MADLTSSSQNATLGASASAITWPQWYDNVVVQNTGTHVMWVNTDGSVVTAAEAGAVVVQPGANVVIANRQAKGQWSKVGAGGDSFNMGGTVQDCQNGKASSLPASGFGTSVSVIGTTGDVVNVIPQ